MPIPFVVIEALTARPLLLEVLDAVEATEGWVLTRYLMNEPVSASPPVRRTTGGVP